MNRTAIILSLCLLPALLPQAADPRQGSVAIDRASLFPDRVVAKGKGIEIRQSQVDALFLAFRSNRAATGQAVPDSARKQIEAEILERLIATELFKAQATPDDRELARETGEQFIAEQKNLAESEQAFRRQLLAVGMTPEEFHRHVMEQSLVKIVIDREIKDRQNITDAQTKAFYDENPTLFRQPEMVRVSHILISNRGPMGQTLTESEKRERRKRAERVLVQARRPGANFLKLVHEHSDEPGARETGGEYTFPRAAEDSARAAMPEFEAAAFSMSPNQISDIVTTRFGFHIIKHHEKIPSRAIEFDRVKDQIHDELLHLAVQEALPPYIEKLKKEASVEILTP